MEKRRELTQEEFFALLPNMINMALLKEGTKNNNSQPKQPSPPRPPRFPVRSLSFTTNKLNRTQQVNRGILNNFAMKVENPFDNYVVNTIDQEYNQQILKDLATNISNKPKNRTQQVNRNILNDFANFRKRDPVKGTLKGL